MIDIIPPGTIVSIVDFTNQKGRIEEVIISRNNVVSYKISYWVDTDVKYIVLFPEELIINPHSPLSIGFRS